MVVEDEEQLRSAVCKMLRRRGYRVIEACDGLTAADTFRAKAAEIDVVLLDLTLPGLSGSALFEEIRRIRPDAKVILTSAYNAELATSLVGGREALEFIRKPYQFADLLVRLQKIPDSGLVRATS
jgi:DNA-binding response OmpR family regulator